MTTTLSLKIKKVNMFTKAIIIFSAFFIFLTSPILQAQTCQNCPNNLSFEESTNSLDFTGWTVEQGLMDISNFPCNAGTLYNANDCQLKYTPQSTTAQQYKYFITGFPPSTPNDGLALTVTKVAPTCGGVHSARIGTTLNSRPTPPILGGPEGYFASPNRTAPHYEALTYTFTVTW
jgi:hypothetical protein